MGDKNSNALQCIADALERIASALETATREPRPTRPADDNRCNAWTMDSVAIGGGVRELKMEHCERAAGHLEKTAPVQARNWLGRHPQWDVHVGQTSAWIDREHGCGPATNWPKNIRRG